MANISDARRIPRISIHAFCEDPRTVEAVQIVGQDRRSEKAHMMIDTGGAQAAIARYRDAPTPNLIIIELPFGRQETFDMVDRLAECCDVGTKAIVIGHVEDDELRRELLSRGVGEYLVTPVQAIQLMESISNLYSGDRISRTIAFLGAKGGVGSSTVCHNVSWSMSNRLKSEVVIADLDLAFGTASHAFNQDPDQGIYDAIRSPDRLDGEMLDRLMTRCSEYLSLIAAPLLLDSAYDISTDQCDSVLDIIAQNLPYVTVDLPHVWTSWSQQILWLADEIVITAAPDIANLRSAKKLVDALKVRRRNDGPPYLVINQAGMRRPDIPAIEFATALGLETSAIINFDIMTFGTAIESGMMLEEVNPTLKRRRNCESWQIV